MGSASAGEALSRGGATESWQKEKEEIADIGARHLAWSTGKLLTIRATQCRPLVGKIRKRLQRSFRGGRLRFLGLSFSPQAKQENQPYSRANCAVCDIKGRKAHLTAPALLKIEIKEVNHMGPKNPVNKVANYPAANEPEGHLA
jgi:hypothetical protein